MFVDPNTVNCSGWCAGNNRLAKKAMIAETTRKANAPPAMRKAARRSTCDTRSAVSKGTLAVGETMTCYTGNHLDFKPSKILSCFWARKSPRVIQNLRCRPRKRCANAAADLRWIEHQIRLGF